MKFLHLSDLHIGKRVNEFSMIEDQRHILEQILEIVKKESPEAVVIAGDVYDKSIPSIEGVTLFDYFLTRLSKCNTTVMLVSGNHDSADRLNYGGKIMENNKIYIAGVFGGKVKQVDLTDQWGEITFHLLPFIKPAMVTPFYEEVETYEEAVEAIIGATPVDTTKRNVLVAHQFIVSGGESPLRSESELESLGGLDQIDASVFKDFDYVALGHLHGPQRIGRDTVRYAGSPLKYSFSEVNQKKSVTLVTMDEKGKVSFELLPLKPLHDMREIEGKIEELVDFKYHSMDYIHATLTNEENLVDPMGRLRTVYPNIMKLDFKNSRTAVRDNAKMAAQDVKSKSPLQLFDEFYEMQNNQPMNEKELEIMTKLLLGLAGEKE